jgi:type II secretory pathway component PulF
MATIGTSALIHFCRRVATAARAGIDIRRIFEQEASRGSGRQRQVMEEIRLAVAAGGSVTEAMRDTRYFPPLVVELTAVGEQTGKLDEVYFRLADHYDHILQQWKAFLFGIWWPLLELFIAILVIALVIWLPSQLSSPGSKPIDMLGLGLVGTRGLAIYFSIVAFISLMVGFVITGFLRNWFGPGPVRLAMRIPLLGPCFEAMAMSRLTWALAMAHESGMSAQRTVNLSLSACDNIYFSSTAPAIVSEVAAGREFHEAFSAPGVFKDEFLTTLQAAELSGTVTESLLRASKDYEERAQTLLRMLTAAATVAVFCLVGLIIILAIFRMAFWYIGGINRFIQDPLNAEF